MNLCIFATQQLLLIHDTSGINMKNIELVNRASLYLKHVENADLIPCKVLDSKIQQYALEFETVMITWRPKYCLDIFLYVSDNQNETIIGLPRHDINNTVDFFSSFTKVSLPINGSAVLMAHLTCDVLPDGQHKMVILIYDALFPQSNIPLMDRYAWLQSNSAHINGFEIGNATCCVQWVGMATAINETKDIQLTHEKNAIVVIGSETGVQPVYEKFTI